MGERVFDTRDPKSERGSAASSMATVTSLTRVGDDVRLARLQAIAALEETGRISTTVTPR